MTIGGVPLPVSIWKGVRVLVEPANVIIINGDDSTTGLPRARREGDEQAEQTYDKCVSHNYGARKIIDEDEDYVQCMASFGGDSVSTVAAVREAQARQRAASRNDGRRCLTYRTVGAHRAPLQLRDPQILKLSHYPSFGSGAPPKLGGAPSAARRGGS